MERPTRPNMPTNVARLPIPGNAELALSTSSSPSSSVARRLDRRRPGSARDWVDFVKWTVSAYMISRGIAKASRVLEQ